MAYHILMILSDFKGLFCCMKPFYITYLGNIARNKYDMSTHESESVTCLFESEGLLKVC